MVCWGLPTYKNEGLLMYAVLLVRRNWVSKYFR